MKKRKVGIKGILKIAADSEKMFDFDDSLSKIVNEDYSSGMQELTDSQLSFAMGGRKEPEADKRVVKKDTNNKI